LPSTSFRWLLVKTDSGLALTLPEKYAGNIMHFGQQEKFFVRFDRSSGLPEISFDLQSWQPYTAGTPVNISRQEQATLTQISESLRTVNDLAQQNLTLTTALTEQQTALSAVQDALETLETELAITEYAHTLTESDLTAQE
jgi:hypothetical protein